MVIPWTIKIEDLTSNNLKSFESLNVIEDPEILQNINAKIMTKIDLEKLVYTGWSLC